MRALCLVVLASLSLVACDSGAEPEFEIGGTYVFEEAASPDTFGRATRATLTIPQTESGRAFSFSYTFERTEAPSGVVVSNRSGAGTGTYDHPGIALRLDGEVSTGAVSDAGGRITIVEDGQEPFIIYVRAD